MNFLRLNNTDHYHALSWKKDILEAMRERVDQALQLKLDISPEPGGWWHQYVCPEHSLPLIFDLTSPDKHYCPAGDVYEGEEYDAAFRVFTHRYYADLARDTAVLFQVTSESRYLDTTLAILMQYADLYTGYKGNQQSQKWMTAGRVFQQALTEAIWTVPLTQSFALISEKCSAQQYAHIENGLLRPLADVLLSAHHELVFKQDKLKSNYNAWLIAGLGHLGFALNDNELIQVAIEKPGGFADHLNAAILSDNTEYEASPYYHNFVVWAYTLLAEVALAKGINLYEMQGSHGQSIQGMWASLASLMWPDGTIPFLDDGNYWQNSSFDKELCETYEIALHRTEDEHYAWLLDCAYQRQGTPRDSWSALAYAKHDIQNTPQVVMPSSYLPDAGLAMLRTGEPQNLAALLRFGACGAGHKHYDNLGVVFYPFSADAGNPPYGLETRRTWYQQTAAHNTVLVNGQSQHESVGKLISWTSETNRTEVIATANEAYPGVAFSRKIAIQSNQIVDEVNLQTSAHTLFDWLLHLDTPLDFEDIELIPTSELSLYAEGAACLLDVVSHATNVEQFSAFFIENETTYRLAISAPSPIDVFMARSPQRGGLDMPRRHTLIVRQTGEQAQFHATYEMLS